MGKKLLSALLSLCVVLALVPSFAWAEGETETGGVRAAGEAKVTIGGGEEQSTTVGSDGIHTFTASSSDVFTFATSGDDGVSGNNKNQTGYFPKIVMPDVASEAQANTYYVLSRGQNEKGLDDTTLKTVLDAAMTANSFPHTYYEANAEHTLANWFQVYAATGDHAWGTDNAAYWPQLGNAPVTNIVVATKTSGDSGNTYTYEKYKFDFTEATVPLPFIVKGGTEVNTDLASLKEGMTVSDLQQDVKAEATTSTLGVKTIEVTGTSKYIAFPEFEADSEGHYVALKLDAVDSLVTKFTVTLSDNSTKEMNPGDTLVWKINEEKTNTKIPVKAALSGTNGANINYVIDCTGVTLLPKAADDQTTVESKGEGDSAVVEVSKENTGKVVLPADADENLSKMTVEIKSVEDADVSGTSIDEAIKNAIDNAAAKIVEVTVKLNDEEQFTGDSALAAGKELTITISGLTAGKTYYVFCLKGDSVTSYGRKTLDVGESEISVKTRHLTQFAAVPQPEDEAAAQALENAVKQVTKEPTTVVGGAHVSGDVTPEQPEQPGSLGITFTAASNSIGPKATVTGLTAGTATVQIAKAANTAPAVIFTMTPSAGKVEFNVNAGSVVTVWDGAVTFANGSPSGTVPSHVSGTAQ